MKKETQAIHGAFPEKDPYGSLSMPVYHTAAYEFENADIMSDAFCSRVIMPDYSRVLNPTVMFLEDKVKTLTGAKDVIAMTSGMAAISNTFMAIAATGKNIVTSRHLFGNTFMLLEKTLKRFGIETRFCDMTDRDDVIRNVDGNTCCLFLEIVTNPQMEVADLKMLGDIAKDHNVPLIADTTMIPFTEFKANELGVDIEIVSSTKYVSGGATSLGGFIIDYGTAKGFGDKIRFELLFNLGAYMTPHVAYMQTIGLETMDVRYKKQSKTAMDLAKKLKEVPAISKVHYIGLEDDPYHTTARKQFEGSYGAMLTIELDDEEMAKRFINNLQLVKRATNLFDNRSLAIHPWSTIFGPLSAEQKREMDIADNLIRLSIGLEDIDDIFEDIRQAAEKAK